MYFCRVLAPLALSAPEITTREAAAARGPHPRMRRRAQAGLGHQRGMSTDEFAAFYAVGRNAVSRWLTRWQQIGLVGLCEGARSGRPAKLVPEGKKVAAYMARPPATPRVRAAPAPGVRHSGADKQFASPGTPAGVQLETLSAQLTEPARPRGVCRVSDALADLAPRRGAGRSGRGLRGRMPLLPPGPRALRLV